MDNFGLGLQMIEGNSSNGGNNKKKEIEKEFPLKYSPKENGEIVHELIKSGIIKQNDIILGTEKSGYAAGNMTKNTLPRRFETDFTFDSIKDCYEDVIESGGKFHFLVDDLKASDGLTKFCKTFDKNSVSNMYGSQKTPITIRELSVILSEPKFYNNTIFYYGGKSISLEEVLSRLLKEY